MSAPYDDAIQDGFGELYFVATFPAFRKLGTRFEQIRESAEPGSDVPDAKAAQDAQSHLAGRAEVLEETDRLLDEVMNAGMADLAARGIPLAPFNEQNLMAECEAIERGLEGEDRPTGLPHGTVCVVCGEAETLTKRQKSLFAWLEKNQDKLIRELSEALRAKYVEILPVLERYHRTKAGERPFLPKVVGGKETDDLFVIREVYLSRGEWEIGLILDSAFHEDEPMGVLISDEEIADIGPCDVAYVTSE